MSDLKNNNQITISGIVGIPEIKSGDNLAELICKYLNEKFPPQNGDIIVVAQKIISKAENCLVDLKSIEPTKEAKKISNITEKDPRLVQLILNNSKEIIKAKKGILIVETIYGYICANAGIDTSNLKEKDSVSFLKDFPKTIDVAQTPLTTSSFSMLNCKSRISFMFSL